MESLGVTPLPPKAGPIEVTAAPTVTESWLRDDIRPLTWYREGLTRCATVARIETGSGDAVATGFVVPGHLLHPTLPRSVFVTNAHVVPESLTANEAIISFHGLSGQAPRTSFRAVRTLWTSASPSLNVTLLELDGRLETTDPLTVDATMPRLDSRPPPRAWLIGHPREIETQQFSFGDNSLSRLRRNDPALHQRHRAGQFRKSRLRRSLATHRRTPRREHDHAQAERGGRHLRR